MKTILAFAALAFAGVTTAVLAGAPPCPEACAPACKPTKIIAVVPVEDSCSGAKDCAGDRGGCHGRSRTTFAQRREARVAGRCAARDARAIAREASLSCHGVQVVQAQVVEAACEAKSCCEDCPCRK